jgi:hypothetical protein
MCTLSFLPADGGCHLLMNRDEQRTRPNALPPRLHHSGKLRSIYPSEQGGGTWIGVNDAGLCGALLNWYARPILIDRPAFSRGLIIPTLLGASSIEGAVLFLHSLPIAKLAPFRLFLFDPGKAKATMLASDGATLDQRELPWENSHWFSSGHDEASASRIRSETAQRAAAESDAWTLPWLRRLHCSHEPQEGAYSFCMHRADARTVSSTEITITRNRAGLTYRDNAPCREHDAMTLTLGLRLQGRIAG